jgi:hypothetical protein
MPENGTDGNNGSESLPEAGDPTRHGSEKPFQIE